MSNYNKDEEKRTPLLGSNYAHFYVYIETINVTGGSERECWILLSLILRWADMNAQVILRSIEP